jgi:hypothetical protein
MRAKTGWIQAARCALIIGVAMRAPAALADAASAAADSLLPAPTTHSDSSTTERVAIDTLGMADLAASTAPPWVPAKPVAARAGWETALQLPMRIVSLPLTELGWIAKRSMISVEDANWIPRVVYLIALGPQVGLSVTPASLGDRTGFGFGVALRPPGVLRNSLSADWNGSTLDYNRTRVTARYHLARVDYIYEWRPQDRFYGLGAASSIQDTSTYADQSQQVRLGLDFRWTVPRRPWRTELAAWAGPRQMITRSGRESAHPSIEEQFPVFLPIMNQRYEHLVYGARARFDSRLGVPRWAHGGQAGVEYERFDNPLGFLALGSADVPFTFQRLTLDAEYGFSFWRDPRTFRFAVRVVDNRPDASGILLPADLASLGGSRGLNGFEPGRFHGADLALGRIVYLFPLATRFELDIHTEIGNVYGDVWHQAKLSGLRQSYGVALRPRADNFLLGAIGVEWSVDTVRLRYSIGGVE